MSQINTYKNFKCHTDNDSIFWVGIDREDTSVNSLSYDLFQEFAQIIDQIQTEKPKAVIIESLKKSGFIAGADISQFTELKTKDEAHKVIRQAQVILDKLEALPIPTVCMIHGFCVGGGCELALACDYRIADDSPKTVIGLPEVKLGIHPGWGGTVRLPKLIGAIKAMGVILAGRVLKAKQAAKLGLIDKAVPKRQLKHAAIYYALNKPAKHKPSFVERLTNVAPVRSFLAKKMRQQLAAKIEKSQYPAPYAAIDNWVKVGVGNKAMETEADSIANLLLTDTAQNLVRVFFLQDRLKSLGKGSAFKPKHVHVVGAGTMGGDIAAWCALKGMKVTLQDQAPQRIAPALGRAAKLFKKKLRDRYLIQAATDRLQSDVAGHGVAQADVIIEAIFENCEAKQQLFKNIEEKAKPNALLATNTSSIPLDEINTALKAPSRLVGIHFFNPVAQMPLVEVVKGDKTSDQAQQDALGFVSKIGKLPLPVKSAPGFLVNRILIPCLMEAMLLIDEGVDKRAIDKAAKDFGMPMGPITLADTVGLDVCLAVGKEFAEQFNAAIPETLVKMVNNNKLGKKSGEGFYQYDSKGKRQSEQPSSGSKKLSQGLITDRLVLRMLNESAACLRDQVVADADLLDAGMIFGTGFAPFKGGPMHDAKEQGFQVVIDKLIALTKDYGERFTPDAYWSILIAEQAKESA